MKGWDKMQKMSNATISKCKQAIDLVYEKGYSLSKAAKEVKISSQTIYTYVDQMDFEAEWIIIRQKSKENSSRKS